MLLDLAQLMVLLDNQVRNPAPLDAVTAFLAGQDDGGLHWSVRGGHNSVQRIYSWR